MSKSKQSIKERFVIQIIASRLTIHSFMVTISSCLILLIQVTRSVLLTQYCAGGKIETNEMGRACGAYGGG